MKGITINTRKKLLDLIDEHKKDTRKEGLENLASDLQITLEFAQNLLDGKETIPVEDNGTDEIINGIVLCPNHHKAFDSGLIWINEGYNTLNHSKIKDIKNSNIAEGLDGFIKNSRIGDKIFLPDNDKFYPDIDYLTKKRDRIFEMNNRSTGVIK